MCFFFPFICLFDWLTGAVVWASENAIIFAAVISAIATCFIAGFTVVLARVTGKQAKLTKAAAEIARDALVVGNGAFVFVPDIRWNWHTEPSDLEGDIAFYTFRPIWQNSGNTQTKNMVTMIAAEFRTSALPLDFDFTAAPNITPPALIGPRSSIVGGSEHPFSVANMEDIAAGRMFLYLWGWAKYQDIFPNTPAHITRYCCQVQAGGNLRSRPVQGKPGPFIDFIVHPRGNCADDECVAQGLG